MKKTGLCALLATVLVLFSACASSAKTAHAYPFDTHTHVYGTRYDVVEPTCLTAGTVARYCKICHAGVTEDVPVPTDESLRAHAFVDTVVEPTESTEGYTTRTCTRCAYEIARVDVVPPQYALFAVETTQSTAPTGALGLAVSDTVTHTLSYLVDGDAAVPADVACHLAVALTLADELTKEGAAVTPDTLVSFGGGNFPVKELLFAYIEEGDAAVLGVLAAAVAGSADGFAALVSARLARLGVGDAIVANPFVPAQSSATLGATAVLLARVLDEPLLLEGYGAAVGRFQLVAGQKPVLYLSSADGTLRVTALAYADTVRFAVVYGMALTGDYEAAVYPV